MSLNGPRNFANPNVDTQTWYVAARSAEVRTGRIRSYHLLHRRIALYRDSAGTVHAMDARCPHLGADLGQGKVLGDTVQCAFHHWSFGPDGRCRSAPDRSVRVYPTEERWGLVWLFNGPRPLFPLPSVQEPSKYRVMLPPQRRIHCHPHLVVGNGLDTRHLQALHDIAFTAEPQWSVTGPFEISATVQGRPRSAWIRRLTGSSHSDIVATFSTLGGNLAWATITQPVRFLTLFTGQSDESGGCRTQLVLFLPPSFDARPIRALVLLIALLRHDRQILDRLQFTHDYAKGDECLRELAGIVDSMPVW